MRVAVLLLLLAGCATDPLRDYTLTACPGAPELVQVRGNGVCDRGVGYSPRFVSWEDCEEEAGLSRLSTRTCSHPSRDPCPQSSPHLFFCSYDSIASAAR